MFLVAGRLRGLRPPHRCAGFAHLSELVSDGTTLAKAYGTTMGIQPGNADNSQKPGSAAAPAPSSRQLGIQFFTIVAFAVICKQADTKPADNHHQCSPRSMNGACRLPDSAGYCGSEAPGTARTPAQS
jgi:hypothetical protein